MKNKNIAAILSVMILAACNNQYVRSYDENAGRSVQINPNLSTKSANDYKGKYGEVRLPQNYSSDNYKRMALAVSFYPMNSTNADRFSTEKSETVSSLFETEIAKLKRFTILSRSHLGTQAIRDEKRFQDSGLVKSADLMRMGKMRGAEYALTGGVAIKSERFDRIKNQEIHYTVMVNYQLINMETGEIEESDTAEGRSMRTYYQLPSGRFAGGFNYKDPKQSQVAVNSAAYNALRIIANKIGNKFPVGGRVVGVKGNRFQIDAGFNQGLMGEQVVVLYAFDGLDIPIAYGEINPGKVKTTGKVIQWNNDPEAQDLIRMLKNDPRGFTLDYDLYAVSAGMPVPKEWDKNYIN